MSSLMEQYLKKYGGATVEKQAEAKDDPAQLLASLFSENEGQEKQAEAEKLAAVYDELGRRLARETFAAEHLGLTEGGEKTAEQQAAEKQAAEKQADGQELVGLLKSLLEPQQEKTAADDGFADFLKALEGAGKQEKTAEEIELEKYTQLGAKLAAGYVQGAKDIVMKILQRIQGMAQAGGAAVAQKAQAVGKGFMGAVRGPEGVAQVAKAFPGQAALLAGGGAAVGAGAGALARGGGDKK